jgi:uncharacterized tellurite resistance protein B-like protein
MLDRLKTFFGSLTDGTQKAKLGPDDPLVAAAALMFHVMEADGESAASEHKRLREVLAEAYQLSHGDVERIIAAGDRAHREAIDLFSFTSVVNRGLDDNAKIEFVGLLFEMVYADGELHELEDNVVWRVAELIGVSQRDRVEMRRLVRERRGFDKDKWDD